MNDAFAFENEYQLDVSDLPEKITLRVESDDVGKRIDAFIAERSELTRSAASRLIENGEQLYTGTKKIDFEGSKEFASTLIGETAITEVEAALAAPPNEIGRAHV